MSSVTWARRTLAGLAAGAALLTSLPASALTLQEALASADAGNPQLAAARAQLRKADEGVPQALAGRWPTVQAEAGVAATTGSNTSRGGSSSGSRAGPVGDVTAKVPLWTGGRVGAAVAVARDEVDAGRATLRATEADVLLRAVTAYVDVLRAQDVLDTYRQHERDLRAEVGSAERRRAAGELRAADVAATDAQLAQARARSSQAEGDLDAAREVFRGVVGAEPRALQPPGMPPGLPGSRDEVVAAAADNPALLAAAKNVDAARSGVERAQAQLRPDVAASATVGYPATTGEVLLTVPLFDGGLAESESRGAKEDLEQRRLELDGEQRSVRQDAVSAWEALTTARAGIEAYQVQADASRAARDGLARERAQGLRTQLEVLQAEQQLLDAELGRTNARHDAVVAAYRVLAVTGQLSPDDLGLAVPSYDPAPHAAAVAGKVWDRQEIGDAYLGRRHG